MAKLKTNRAANKRYGLTATGKIKRTKSKQKTLISKQKQVDKERQEKYQMLMLTNHAKKQLKNYYHMVDNQLEKKQNKEGEKNGKSKNSQNNKSKT